MALTIPVVSASGAKSTCSLADPVVVSSTPPIFNGDYSTGNFAQWPSVHTKAGSVAGSSFTGSYSAVIVTDTGRGKVARMEVRPGDVFAGGERAEARGDWITGGMVNGASAEGRTHWYKFSTKFDATFPSTWSSSTWFVTNQWHCEDNVAGAPTICMGSTGWNGNVGSWELNSKAATGNPNNNVALWHGPLNRGQWNDVVMEVKWSRTNGYINLWVNGARQTFDNGSQTWTGPTMVPGSNGAYYKEGLYRSAQSAAWVVYHAGFRCATTQAGLG